MPAQTALGFAILAKPLADPLAWSLQWLMHTYSLLSGLLVCSSCLSSKYCPRLAKYRSVHALRAKVNTKPIGDITHFQSQSMRSQTFKTIKAIVMSEAYSKPCLMVWLIVVAHQPNQKPSVLLRGIIPYALRQNPYAEFDYQPQFGK